MRVTGALGAVLLAGAGLGAFPGVPAQAQAAAKHEVLKGDTLFGIVRQTRHDGVTRNQMILAIYRANQSAFAGGNPNMLEAGTVLVIPERDAVARIETIEGDRLVRELLSKWAAAPVGVPPGREEAARRYREGVAMERRGDEQGALKAFLEAGEGGHGLAQRRLGQIYDKGNAVARRDYQSALMWYQKAREQGVEMDKPLQRTTPK